MQKFRLMFWLDLINKEKRDRQESRGPIDELVCSCNGRIGENHK